MRCLVLSSVPGRPAQARAPSSLPPFSANEQAPSLVFGWSLLRQPTWAVGTETHVAYTVLGMCYLAICRKSLLTSGPEQCLTPNR